MTRNILPIITINDPSTTEVKVIHALLQRKTIKTNMFLMYKFKIHKTLPSTLKSRFNIRLHMKPMP